MSRTCSPGSDVVRLPAYWLIVDGLNLIQHEVEHFEFAINRLVPLVERSKHRTTDGKKVGGPTAFIVRFDMRSPTDSGSAEHAVVERIAVNPNEHAGRLDNDIHDWNSG